MRSRLASGISLLGLMLALFSTAAAAPAREPWTAGDILQELRNFRETGSVLYVAAHPDDENNRLLPYLARGRALRTAYLSLTRGDGGQNLIGPELGDQLGVIRTQELLAARRIDGAAQFFTRAKDFGFSKDSADTLRRWDRQQVVGDIVRVIRTFRPDVVINRFSTVPGGTHGHHTASAILSLEAFQLAGDPHAFPEQLTTLKPWQPKRLLWNSWTPDGSAPLTRPNILRLDSGGYDPLLGESFGEIGARGRSMHKSQGEGRSGTRGAAFENFQLVAGAAFTSDLLDGVDHTWARWPGGAEIAPLADALVAHFDPLNPAGSAPALLTVRRQLAALPDDPVIALKRAQLDRILRACLGLFVETVLPQAEVVPGERLKLRHNVIVRSDHAVRWVGVRLPGVHREYALTFDLSANHVVGYDTTEPLPATTPLSQPYWLREPGSEGMTRVDDPALIGRPTNPPAFPVEFVFEIDGQSLVVPDEPVQIITDPVRGEIRRPLEVIPPVSLAWSQPLELFTPGATKTVAVEIAAARRETTGTLRIAAPAGWQITPAAQPFALHDVGERTRREFSVTAPASPATAQLTATAEIGGESYQQSRIEIRYDHIPAQLLQPPATAKVVALPLEIRGHTVGYLPGAGDLVAESLTRMGYAVTLLNLSDLTPEKLQRFDAVVIGVRAFNVRADLDSRLPALFAYAEQGGNVIVQYNTASNALRGTRLAPYALELSGGRVTSASAPVTFLAPEHPVFHVPNEITSADFAGWVQERARYVPASWGPEFTPVLAMGDPGETPLTGTLLIARHGRGHFVYTSLSWFRELPAGVPGAYRLFANLVSLGK